MYIIDTTHGSWTQILLYLDLVRKEYRNYKVKYTEAIYYREEHNDYKIIIRTWN